MSQAQTRMSSFGTEQRELAGAMSGEGGGIPGRVFGVAVRERTYRRLAYLILSFPLGVAYFAVMATLISTGVGLAITLLGIPLLIATMYLWCAFGQFERWHVVRLLRLEIPPLPFDEPGPAWSSARIKQRLTNPMTWRVLAFLFVRLPQGIVALALSSSVLTASGWLLVAPVVYRWLDNGDRGDNGYEFGIWRADTLPEALLLALAAPVVFVAGLHLLNLYAAISERLTVAFLGGSVPARFDASSAPATPALPAWDGVRAGPLPPQEARMRSIQVQLLIGHLIAQVAIVLTLFVINGLSTPGTWWALWPAWGLAIVSAPHAGYFLRGFLGAHILFFATIMFGLFVIDSTYTGASWFYWPLLGWGVAVALHAYLVFAYAPAIRREFELDPAPNRPLPQSLKSSGPDIDATDPAPAQPAAPPVATSEPEPMPAVPVSRGIAVDPVMRTVSVGGVPFDATPKEFDLLSLLVQNPGRPFSRDELLDRIWKNDYEVTDRTVDTHVQRLRKKLGGQADAIQTVWGIGYRYQPPD